MVLIRTRRSVSLRPSTGSSMPTPKSKPSSTRYPVHSTPSRMNQKVVSSTMDPQFSIPVRSVGEAERGVVGFGLFRARVRNAFARIPFHQAEPDDGEYYVEQGEYGQGGEHRERPYGGDAAGGEHAHGRVARRVRGHHPGLTAHLGEDPAGQVGQERHRQAEQRE